MCASVWTYWNQSDEHDVHAALKVSESPVCTAVCPPGVPTDLLESYPVLKEFRNSIATLPEVVAFYR
jgi:hypothetical protein